MSDEEREAEAEPEGEDETYEYEEDAYDEDYEYAEEEVYSSVSSSQQQQQQQLEQQQQDSTQQLQKAMYYENRFDYLMPDLFMSDSTMQSITIDGGKRRLITENPMWASTEYISIFQILKYVMKHSHQYRMALEWEQMNEDAFRRPLIEMHSAKSSEIVYFFNIAFQSKVSGVFPEVPPVIIPHFSMCPSLYFFTLHFPLLTSKFWNPCQDLVSIIEILCDLWDEMIGSNKKWANSMYDGALLGGTLNSFPLSTEEIENFLSLPNEECPIEILLSLWFGSYQNECNYNFGNLNEILENISGSNSLSIAPTGSNKTIASLSSVKNILAACPKPTQIKVNIAKYSGTGYSTSNSAKEVVVTTAQPLGLRVISKICSRLENVILDLNKSPNLSHSKRIAEWLIESPLLCLIEHEISHLSPGDALRTTDVIYVYLETMNHLETLIRLGTVDLNAGDLQLMSNIYYIAKTLWIDTNMIEEEWTDVAHQNVVVTLFKSYMALRCPHVEEQTKSKSLAEKIFFVVGLEAHSCFLPDLKQSAKCPKFFIRELKTLKSSLSDDVLVFASETSPNVLKCVMFPQNDDCPYYGGSYLFDVFIPDNYPDVSPKVKFLTTGRGTVRFNPNLYNCGKVCLSLLGTWSGEPWNPKLSNLTQVLNSILFLIFTQDPYFNEPGFKRGEASDKQSIAYDCNIFEKSIEFAMKDHLINDNPIVEIQHAICQYYVENWARLYPVILKKFEYYQEQNVLHATSCKKNLETISNWVKGQAQSK